LKPFYADYVNHILRFYTRHSDRNGFPSEIDRLNHDAADKVLSSLDYTEKNIIIDIYSRGDAVSNNIQYVAAMRGMDPKTIWALICRITNEIAKERKLIQEEHNETN